MKKYTNVEIAEFSVELASYRLNIPYVNVAFKSSKFFNRSKVDALFIPKQYTIVFNKTWIKSTDFLDVLKCGFYYTRQVYQHACVLLPEKVKHDPIVVFKWKKEFDLKLDSYDCSRTELDSVRDANKYSQVLLEQVLNELEDDRYSPGSERPLKL